LAIRRYWTTACAGCAIKDRCTPGRERRISRWEHEAVLDAVQRRLDEESPRVSTHPRPKAVIPSVDE
ncbi:MAG: IS5/IS1182 family transposase, partial [Thermohalobaculum sp.]